MKFESVIKQCGRVTFPEFTGERVYMREFRKSNGLPFDLARWQPTVDQMLDGVDTDGPIYLMVDQGYVSSGTTHRREGIHIDGYWNPGVHAHGSGHTPIPAGHRSYGGHGGISSENLYRRHRGLPPSYKRDGKHSSGISSWSHATFEEPEGLILASDISACMGYVGQFDGPIGEGGDCSHVDLSTLDSFLMDSHSVYVGNVTCLHESIPVGIECHRTLVRLNVPGWSM